MRKNKCCTDIYLMKCLGLFFNKESVLWCWHASGRKWAGGEDSVVVASVKRCFQFCEVKKICRDVLVCDEKASSSSNVNAIIYLVWYHAVVLSLMYVSMICLSQKLPLYDERFYFSVKASVIFCCLRSRRLKKKISRRNAMLFYIYVYLKKSESDDKGKQWGLKWLKVLFVLWLPAQQSPHNHPSLLSRTPIMDYYIPKKIGLNKCFK